MNEPFNANFATFFFREYITHYKNLRSHQLQRLNLFVAQYFYACEIQQLGLQCQAHNLSKILYLSTTTEVVVLTQFTLPLKCDCYAITVLLWEGLKKRVLVFYLKFERAFIESQLKVVKAMDSAAVVKVYASFIASQLWLWSQIPFVLCSV